MIPRIVLLLEVGLNQGIDMKMGYMLVMASLV